MSLRENMSLQLLKIKTLIKHSGKILQIVNLTLMCYTKLSDDDQGNDET